MKEFCFTNKSLVLKFDLKKVFVFKILKMKKHVLCPEQIQKDQKS